MKPCSECGKPAEAVIEMRDAKTEEGLVEGLFCKLCIVNGGAGESLLVWAKYWL